MLETALNVELTEHLGDEKDRADPDRESGNPSAGHGRTTRFSCHHRKIALERLIPLDGRRRSPVEQVVQLVARS